MKFTATDGVHVDDGLYNARLMGLEQREAGENSPTQDPYVRWKFVVYEEDGNPIGTDLTANSSMSFGPKAKARKWMQQILGRVIEPGEVIDPEKECPLECRVMVKNDAESGFSRIEDVLGAKQGQKAKNGTKPDEQSDGVPDGVDL